MIDHSSGYNGKYALLSQIIAYQNTPALDWLFNADLLIHIGEHAGDYCTPGKLTNRIEVWRVSEDGELRDTFNRLTKVFEMTELQFFNHYANLRRNFPPRAEQLKFFQNELEQLYNNIPELPFSNVWCAQHTVPKLPKNSLITFGLSTTMRSWTYFGLDKSIKSRSNAATRGIDGPLSTCVGMSLVNPEKITFIVLGDLAFFYDMTVMGNRDIKSNLRIMLFNNGGGTEFHNYYHTATLFGKELFKYIAAGGHFGNKSRQLVRSCFHREKMVD